MHKSIVPIYQPIIDLRTGEVLYYEALARACVGAAHAHGRLIRLGEELGFIDLLDLAMLDQVAEALRRNTAVAAAVNLSGVTIAQSSSELIAAIFKHQDVVPRVVFEITETADIRNLGMLPGVLKMLGARMALDDFGVGFATLDMVSRYQPAFVKLSGQVVVAMAETGDAGAIMEVCTATRAYGGEIIAEHIDSRAKAEAVSCLGIRYVQGYWAGRHVATIPITAACTARVASGTSPWRRPGSQPVPTRAGLALAAEEG